jgi:hypothetical protein
MNYRIFVGIPEGKRPLRRLKHRWYDNIKKDYMNMGREAVDCLTWLRIETVCYSYEHSSKISASIKAGEFLDYIGDYQLLKQHSAPFSHVQYAHY